MLLAGAVVFNFGSLDRGARLDESAPLVESLFRYARAQASSRGREVVVVFGDAPAAGAESGSSSSNTSGTGTGSNPASTSSSGSGSSTNSSAGTASAPIPAGVQVLWEPDPIGAPGKFELLPGAYSLTEQLNELIRVHEVRPPSNEGDSAQAAAAKSAESPTTNENAVAGTANATATRPVKFFPDGSSDSVEVVLGTLDDQDVRRLSVSLSGTTGTLRHRFFSLGPDGEPVAPAAPGAEGSPGTQP